MSSYSSTELSKISTALKNECDEVNRDVPSVAVSSTSSSSRRSKTDKQVPKKSHTSKVKSVASASPLSGGKWITKNKTRDPGHIGNPTHGHAIRMRPKSVTPNKKDEDHYAHMHVDLMEDTTEQELLPGSPLSTMKNRHKLFYSYDPRGSKDADGRYFTFCKCPKNYCSKVAMGDIVVYSVDLHVKHLGILHQCFQGRAIEVLYNKYYSKQVHQKMLENGFGQEEGFHENCYYTIPVCIQPLLDEARNKLYAARDAAQKVLQDKSDAYYDAKYNRDKDIEM